MAPTTSPMHICSDLQSGSPSPRITLVPRSSAFSLSDQTSTPSSTSGAIVYPSSTGSSGLSSTGMTILGAVLVGGLLIAIFAILLCLGSARIHSGINPLSSSLSERSTMRGEIHDLAEMETSALLQRARVQRDASPKTAQSIDGEMRYLRQVLGIYRAMSQTQETFQRMFDVLRSLVENSLDLLMVSHLPQSHVENVRLWCEELMDIARRIERPWTLMVAQFYKGHLFIAQARLLERNESNQTTASKVMDLFAEAFENFYTAKQISRRFQRTPDRQIQMYLSHSMLSCAFIVSKFPQLGHLESDLMTDPEYMSFRSVLRLQPNNELLEKEMLQLDDRLYT